MKAPLLLVALLAAYPVGVAALRRPPVAHAAAAHGPAARRATAAAATAAAPAAGHGSSEADLLSSAVDDIVAKLGDPREWAKRRATTTAAPRRPVHVARSTSVPPPHAHANAALRVVSTSSSQTSATANSSGRLPAASSSGTASLPTALGAGASGLVAVAGGDASSQPQSTAGNASGEPLTLANGSTEPLAATVAAFVSGSPSAAGNASDGLPASLPADANSSALAVVNSAARKKAKRWCGNATENATAGRACGNITHQRKQNWQTHGPPAINASGGENVCKKVGFVAIQKTGTTTLYMHILPAMTKRQGQIFTYGHVNYRAAVWRVPPYCMFTVLRDPVDRFLSEFAMARGPSGMELFTHEWDFHQSDLAWLRRMETMKNVTEAMDEYLHSPNNPTRNRQTLYLLGFDHIQSCRQVFYRNYSWANCPQGEHEHPAHEYDWTENSEALLAKAKEHLLSMRAFGLTDCYHESLWHIGKAMGWDPDLTVAQTELYRERFAEADKRWVYLGGQAKGGKHEYRMQTKLEGGVHRLAHYISPEMEAEIRRVNFIDDELVKFARQQLVEQGLSSCQRD